MHRTQDFRSLRSLTRGVRIKEDTLAAEYITTLGRIRIVFRTLIFIVTSKVSRCSFPTTLPCRNPVLCRDAGAGVASVRTSSINGQRGSRRTGRRRSGYRGGRLGWRRGGRRSGWNGRGHHRR